MCRPANQNQRMHRQSGLALITALLILALAAMLAYALIDDAARLIDRTRGHRNALAAEQLSQGMLDYALIALTKEQQETGAIDANDEAWAQALPTFPTPRGAIGGKLVDLNGRLNINGLARLGPAADQTRVRFARLLELLKLDPQLAGIVADALDRNQSSEYGGEDGWQMAAALPTRSANRKLAHISELAPIIGEEAYQRLLPFVCALSMNAPININTARPQVLMSLHPAISAELAERFYAEGRARREDISSFIAELAQTGVVLDAEQQRDLSVSSTHFLARVNVLWDGENFRYSAMLERQPGVAALRWKARGELE